MCLMQLGVKFTVGLTQITRLFLALLFGITHINAHTAHTGVNRVIHKYISAMPIMCSQQLSALN